MQAFAPSSFACGRNLPVAAQCGDLSFLPVLFASRTSLPTRTPTCRCISLRKDPSISAHGHLACAPKHAQFELDDTTRKMAEAEVRPTKDTSPSNKFTATFPLPIELREAIYDLLLGVRQDTRTPHGVLQVGYKFYSELLPVNKTVREEVLVSSEQLSKNPQTTRNRAIRHL